MGKMLLLNHILNHLQTQDIVLFHRLRDKDGVTTLKKVESNEEKLLEKTLEKKIKSVLENDLDLLFKKVEQNNLLFKKVEQNNLLFKKVEQNNILFKKVEQNFGSTFSKGGF
jgi:hypothetical protein